jgi:PAS domain S-box-containing protein
MNLTDDLPPIAADPERLAEQRLELLANYSRDVLCETREGVITYVTPNTANVTGLTPEALVGRRIKDVVHPDDWEALSPFMTPGRTGEIEATSRAGGHQAEAGRWHRPACRRIKSRLPGVAVALLRAFWDDAHVRRAIDAGADGYLLKAPSTST